MIENSNGDIGNCTWHLCVQICKRAVWHLCRLIGAFFLHILPQHIIDFKGDGDGTADCRLLTVECIPNTGYWVKRIGITLEKLKT